MEPTSDAFRRWDLFGTLLASMVVMIGSVIAWFGIQVLGAAKEISTELGADLPWLTRAALWLQQAHLPAVITLSLLFLSLFMLLRIPDRQRANLYAGLTGLLLGLSGGALLAVAVLPLVKIMSLMGT